MPKITALHQNNENDGVPTISLISPRTALLPHVHYIPGLTPYWLHAQRHPSINAPGKKKKIENPPQKREEGVESGIPR